MPQPYRRNTNRSGWGRPEHHGAHGGLCGLPRCQRQSSSLDRAMGIRPRVANHRSGRLNRPETDYGTDPGSPFRGQLGRATVHRSGFEDVSILMRVAMRRKKQVGFSLIETMVALAVLFAGGGIVMSGMVQLMKTQGTIANRTDMHTSVRSATELLQQEIGQAGKMMLPPPLLQLTLVSPPAAL